MKFIVKFLFFFMLFSSTMYGQATITIEVNWPFWSSENRVTFRDPSNVQIGASICDPSDCFNGFSNNAYDNSGSLETYLSVPYGTGYDILMEDTYGDGWNGGASYVRVFQDGVLIVDTDLASGLFSNTFTFDIVAPVPAVEVNDVSVNENAGNAVFTVTHTGADASGAFSVDYAITAVSATEGTDYTTGSGLLLEH